MKTIITPLAPILSIDAAIEQESFFEQPLTLSSGQAENAYAAAPCQLAGELYAGGQEHFYLEGQAAIAQADENGGIELFVSTQHPSEIQHKVAGMLGLTYGDIQVDVRRMGGGFGGKESQSNLTACIAALAAYKQVAQPALSMTEMMTCGSQVSAMISSWFIKLALIRMGD